jgi:hypothetical protein
MCASIVIGMFVVAGGEEGCDGEKWKVVSVMCW